MDNAADPFPLQTQFFSTLFFLWVFFKSTENSEAISKNVILLYFFPIRFIILCSSNASDHSLIQIGPWFYKYLTAKLFNIVFTLKGYSRLNIMWFEQGKSDKQNTENFIRVRQGITKSWQLKIFDMSVKLFYPCPHE